MGKIKLYDIAKELNLTSKEVLELAKKLNIDAKSHLSSVDEADAVKIRESVKSSKPKKEDKKPEKSKSDKNETPVIIRREVIINDDNNAQKEHVKKEEKRNNHVGFVERKQNKDYNIVYRNKPTKPMTVDELFGIKKEVVVEKPVPQSKPEFKQENRFNQNRNNNNRDFRQNNNRDNDFANRNRFNNDRNPQNNGNRNFDRNAQNNGNRNFDRNRQGGFNNNNNRFDKNRQGGNPRFGGNRPLDEKGIERNIKDIMAVETIEKEPAREYNKAIDKQKQNSKSK